MDKERIIKKMEEEKWARHRATDKREAMIDRYESKYGKMNQDELAKIRKMYDSYIAEGKDFKIEYIQMILNYNRKKTNEKCNRESMSCEVEKRGCKGCYYDEER